MRRFFLLLFACTFLFHHPIPFEAWFDETHVAIAKAAGYPKWFNACGPDMIREKIGDREDHNHFVNNPRGIVVTPEIVIAQIGKYNKIDPHGHLYGAIIASVRDYIKKKNAGKYAECHLGFCAHYVADLSQPLHNIEHTAYNREHYSDTDAIINDEIMANLDKINLVELVKSQKVGFSVIPAKAGIQFIPVVISSLDSGFHRSDDFLRDHQP